VLWAVGWRLQAKRSAASQRKSEAKQNGAPTKKQRSATRTAQQRQKMTGNDAEYDAQGSGAGVMTTTQGARAKEGFKKG
jgi:hypothetical protein